MHPFCGLHNLIFYRSCFIPLFKSLLNDLSDIVFSGVGPAGFESRAGLTWDWQVFRVEW